MYIDYRDKDCTRVLSDALKEYELEKYTIVCVGSNQVTGDLLAPLVGDRLKDRIELPVYGTLDKKVNAENIDSFKKINPSLVIDSGLSVNGNVNSIQLKHGSASLGSGVGKDLPEVGDLSLIGYVSKYPTEGCPYKVLMDVPLPKLKKMAKMMQYSIEDALDKRRK